MALWESFLLSFFAKSAGLSLFESLSDVSARAQSSSSTASTLLAFTAACNGYVKPENIPDFFLLLVH